MRLKNVGVFDSNFLMIFVIIFYCFCIQFCYGYPRDSSESLIPVTTGTTAKINNVSQPTNATSPKPTHITDSGTVDTSDTTASETTPEFHQGTPPPDNTAFTSSTDVSSTTPTADGNAALLYAIIAICATVIIVAICCGCICLIKMRYRFTSLRVNFYGQGGMFRRGNNNNGGGGTITSTHAANEYITHQYENEKIEFDKWEIPINDLLIDKTTKLGSGAFASVYKGYLKGKNPLLENIGNINFALEMAENRDNEVAIKMLHSHADDDSREELKKEIAFMKTLGYHPHVLSMIGCVSSIYEPLLIVEYCANGDLLTLLRRHKDYILVNPEDDCPAQADFCLSLRDLLSFSWQISDGLVYLSSKNFIHRDIACRNVLITKRMVAKISDFGLCRYSQEALYTTKVGKLPIKWMAIEALKLAEFTSKSDVWSYGVLLFELFSVGDTPYPSISPSDMLDFLLQGNRLPKPELCPEELYNMMQIMWDVNPDSRPTFETIRRNLSAFLEVSSDAYGYIQVSQDYGRFYSKLEYPLKPTVMDEEKPLALEEGIAEPEIVIIPSKEIVIQKKSKEIKEKNIEELIDNVNGPSEVAATQEDFNNSKTPLIEKRNETIKEICEANGCPSMEQLLKDYFDAKGFNSHPNLENAKQDLKFQIKNVLHNFELQQQQQKQQQEQLQNPNNGVPYHPIFPFNPAFQHPQQRFNPMQNPMFQQQRQFFRMPQFPLIQPQHQYQPIPQFPPQQQHQPRQRFSRPEFSNRHRFNFRPRPSQSPQNSYYSP